MCHSFVLFGQFVDRFRNETIGVSFGVVRKGLRNHAYGGAQTSDCSGVILIVVIISHVFFCCVFFVLDGGETFF
jgi:hypothetical protein